MSYYKHTPSPITYPLHLDDEHLAFALKIKPLVIKRAPGTFWKVMGEEVGRKFKMPTVDRMVMQQQFKQYVNRLEREKEQSSKQFVSKGNGFYATYIKDLHRAYKSHPSRKDDVPSHVFTAKPPVTNQQPKVDNSRQAMHSQQRPSRSDSDSLNFLGDYDFDDGDTPYDPRFPTEHVQLPPSPPHSPLSPLISANSPRYSSPSHSPTQQQPQSPPSFFESRASSPRSPLPSYVKNDMTVREVVKVIKTDSHKLPTSWIEEHDIDGAIFQTLTDLELKQFGVQSFGHRYQIIHLQEVFHIQPAADLPTVSKKRMADIMQGFWGESVAPEEFRFKARDGKAPAVQEFIEKYKRGKEKEHKGKKEKNRVSKSASAEPPTKKAKQAKHTSKPRKGTVIAIEDFKRNSKGTLFFKVLREGVPAEAAEFERGCSLRAYSDLIDQFLAKCGLDSEGRPLWVDGSDTDADDESHSKLPDMVVQSDDDNAIVVLSDGDVEDEEEEKLEDKRMPVGRKHTPFTWTPVARPTKK